jgi:hypothetical protein
MSETPDRPPLRLLTCRPVQHVRPPVMSTPAWDMAARMAETAFHLARLNLPVAEAINGVMEYALEEVLDPTVDEHERQRTQQTLRDLVASWTESEKGDA